MKKIIVTTNEEIDLLRNKSALTWEGLDSSEESLNQVTEWINQFGNFKNPKYYIIKGCLMNTYSNLTGDNAYPSDLTIVCVDFNEIENLQMGKLALERFQVGGRWLDDVCDNNERREQEK